MPRFFFDIYSPNSLLRDDIGIDLPSDGDARSEAVRGARSILAEDLKAGRPLDHQQFRIRNEAGELVYLLRFRDVFTLDDGLDG